MLDIWDYLFHILSHPCNNITGRELLPRVSSCCILVKKSFYVDDCLMGPSSVQEATKIREDLNTLLENENDTKNVEV